MTRVFIGPRIQSLGKTGKRYRLGYTVYPGLKKEVDAFFLPTGGQIATDYRSAYKNEFDFLETILHELIECANQITLRSVIEHEDINRLAHFFAKELYHHIGLRIDDSVCVIPKRQKEE